LLWLARHLPGAVKPDHLTALGFASLLAVCLSYWYARHSVHGLWLAILFLALNWFGDSLDGTLARVRGKQRPRYGFYVDHVLDACGSVFLFSGPALSGYMREPIAMGLLVAYFLVTSKYIWQHTPSAAFTCRLRLLVRQNCGHC
jgi:phosphatidylglycerophosphate synthase